MANLKDIFKLCKEENGRLIFLNEEGDITYVLLSGERYEEVLGLQSIPKKIETKPTPKQPDPEEINRKIVEAQLTETTQAKPVVNEPIEPVVTQEKQPMITDSMHIGNVLQERLKQWPRTFSVPTVQTQNGSDESIDPSFDFEGPKLSIEDI